MVGERKRRAGLPAARIGNRVSDPAQMPRLVVDTARRVPGSVERRDDAELAGERIKMELGLGDQIGDLFLALRCRTGLKNTNCVQRRAKRLSTVALIIVDVCVSVSFLMHRCPGTMLHTSGGR